VRGRGWRVSHTSHSFHTRQKMYHLHTFLTARQKNQQKKKNTYFKFTFKSSNTIAQLIKLHTTTIPSPNPHDTSGIYSLSCNTCKQGYVGQTGSTLKLRYQEHTSYLKNNDPQSAYAQHILHNRHEYGPIDKTMTLLKPLSNTSY
jgi:hypothetical protein